MSRQPEVNIGMIGHVDHGKTTLTKALTGRWADTHSEEVKRGITIKLGYADAAFYKCPECDEPDCYMVEKKCPTHKCKCELLRDVSFVDSPGHETLMATMLSGAALMDGALLLIAANDKCPQLQTKEHLTALSIIGIEKFIVVQNKIDLVEREKLLKNYEEIKEFIGSHMDEEIPIIPVSAHHDANIDVLIKAIEETLPTPKRDEKKPARMFVARSFDVNVPGSIPDSLKGGIIGGSLLQGTFQEGDEVEIAPGFENSEETFTTTITSLFAGGKKLKKTTPGGLIGIGTLLDPAFTKSDGLVGKVVGKPGTIPPILSELTMELNLLDYVVGTSDGIKVDEIKTREPLMLNIGTATTVGMVTSARKEDAEAKLKIPVCAEIGQRVAISRRITGKWRLIGHGIIQ